MEETPEIPAAMVDLLQQMLRGPVDCEEKNPKAYPALVRSLMRLRRLRDELRDVNDDVALYAAASYESIFGTVQANLDEDGSAELERLGARAGGRTISETRIAATLLYGWLDHVVSNIETQRQAETMLGGKLSELLGEAQLVPEPTNTVQHAATGMYL